MTRRSKDPYPALCRVHIAGKMAKTFFRRRKVPVNDTSWRAYDSISVRQLGADSDNRVTHLVTYSLIVTHMNMAEHERFTQDNIINQRIAYFTID